LLSTQLGSRERGILKAGRIRYVVADQRLTKALPVLGSYVERGEHGNTNYVAPLDPAALSKFDRVTKVSRVFDSGDIVIYDVGALVRDP